MPRPSTVDRVLFAQERHLEPLLERPGVIAVATGYKEKAGKPTDVVSVQVFVEKKRPLAALSDAERVPATVAGWEDQDVRTDVIEITLPEALQDTTRYRPVPGGCSIGPEASVSAGTLGGWACDNVDDTTVLLTNNHVISNLDAMPALRRIVQPGRLDGGVLPADVIGALKRHVAVSTVANVAGAPTPPLSVVDAAIGTITVGRTDNVLQTGPAIYELQAPALRMNVQKRGRTTRLTTNGRITSVNVTTLITYRNRTRLGRVGNAFVISSTDGNVFSAAGDSGSLIFNQQAGQLRGTLPVVGLLFGGATAADGTPLTLANDINAVFGALNLTTICTCVVRAIIRAIGSSAEAAETGTEAIVASVRKKERQLRRLRDEILPGTPLGKRVNDLVTGHAAELSRVLTEHDDAFDLAVELLEPWLKKRTNQQVLETSIDAETARRLKRFATRVGRSSRQLRRPMGDIAAAIAGAEGVRVRDFLRKGKL